MSEEETPKAEETPETVETVKDEAKEEKQAKPKKEKPAKAEEKQEGGDEGFVHRVRLAGVIVDGNLTITQALMELKGVGNRIAKSMIPKLDMDKERKIGSLNEKEITEVEKKIEEANKNLPVWMLNRRRDPETGEVIATVGDTGSFTGAGLHFEIRHHGKPENPLGWIKKKG